MADGLPVTSAELAEKTGLQERYLREWLSALASAGYVTFDPAAGRFRLPPEHAPVLADDSSPFSFGGWYEFMPSAAVPMTRIITAFRQGGGVSQDQYPATFWRGLERTSGVRYRNNFVQEWIPPSPACGRSWRQGATVADVGCGTGFALQVLAEAFPNIRCAGYDVFPPNVAASTERLKGSPAADRVSFVVHDAAEPIPETYDLVLAFDVVHDSANPAALVRGLRQAVKPDGTLLLCEITSEENLEDNAGPLGAMKYGLSVLYCMTTSLSQGGDGLGTVGLPEPRLKELCLGSGFTRFERLWQNPAVTVYAAHP